MQDRRHQLVILLFTLVQLILVFVLGYTPYPDSEGYIALARESLSLDGGSLYPVAHQLNHYAFLWNLGSINVVIASLWMTGSIMPLLVLYALMKGATAWFLHQSASALSGRHTAAVVLWLYVLYPANYGEATSVLSEVPFICLAMGAVWMCVCKGWYVGSGILLAVANWMRPFSIVFIVALIVWFLFNRKKTLRLLCGYAAAICLIGSLSYLRTGLFLYQAKTGWMALAQYSWDHDSQRDASIGNPSVVCQDSTLNVTEKDRTWRSMFFTWLADNKTEYFRQMPAKLVNTYISDNVNFCAFIPQKQEKDYLYEPLSLPNILSRFPHLQPVQWLALLNLLFYYCLLLTAVLAVFKCNWRHQLLPMAVIASGTLMLLLVGHGEARFHQPFMPFFMLLAASYITLKTEKHEPATHPVD